MRFYISITALAAFIQCSHAKGPFLQTIDATRHVIGNNLWNVTIGPIYGTKLFYRDHDLVGGAVGHYVSYNGAASNLAWNSVAIYKKTDQFLDVVFTANEGEFHWVIFPELAGAYQYFVNTGLPVLGEFRTLWRLDNTTFLSGKTNIKDGPLPTFTQIQNATKVQDETWVQADGTYITKYDWTDFIRNSDYYGVYGPSFGSWYIDVGKDDYNGDHLKQELMVHRESSTGDVVQLNMIHGTHFQASSSDAFPVGKVWGPWLWYLNDGTLVDASRRAKDEAQLYPYSWFDNESYQSRGVVSGKIKLSDGRPAKGAAVFLGDNHPNETSLDQGRYYYYTTYADDNGNFKFSNVRTASYGLQAWSNGGSIRDVSTVLLINDVTVSKGKKTTLGDIVWKTQGRKQIFQLGDLDRKSLGFKYGGAPHEHALVAKCPANLTYVANHGNTIEWCFGQSALGTWTILFDINALPTNTSAVLSISLAGYSSGVSSSIFLNKSTLIGNLTSASIATDPCLYRSGTTAGEWHYFEFSIPGGLFVKGTNMIDFTVTRSSQWHGFMWDSIILEYA
ncbi:hypothetical protein BP5796_02070 [Coleophoma crateriformis]|uniref:rhamnogalacturonan endolyase n=1 Tax=Coleophoma crateriformis TaxID=565419 RepID=A0A3D8T292_9HELO|nr:hypothetical protein BP5796_02070 [Coleophoma crateriformis]